VREGLHDADHFRGSIDLDDDPKNHFSADATLSGYGGIGRIRRLVDGNRIRIPTSSVADTTPETIATWADAKTVSGAGPDAVSTSESRAATRAGRGVDSARIARVGEREPWKVDGVGREHTVEQKRRLRWKVGNVDVVEAQGPRFSRSEGSAASLGGVCHGPSHRRRPIALFATTAAATGTVAEAKELQPLERHRDIEIRLGGPDSHGPGHEPEDRDEMDQQ
jgi:hypothetical protein